MTATLSHRKELCFWGWGYADEGLTEDEEAHLGRVAQGMGAVATRASAPVLDDFALPAPRITPSAAVAGFLALAGALQPGSDLGAVAVRLVHRLLGFIALALQPFQFRAGGVESGVVRKNGSKRFGAAWAAATIGELPG